MSLARRSSSFSITPTHLRIASFAAVLATSGPVLAQAPAASIEKADEPIDVRVEGDRGAPRSSRDPGVASFVIRGDALKRPGTTAVDLLLTSPGVEPSRTGAGSDFSTVSIRGAPSAELPVYLAGVRLNDDVTGAADLSTIPLFALERVEVFRGNAPADADRLGIGGAVFLEPRFPRGTHAGATLGAGSFGALMIGGIASLGDDRAGALFSFTRQSAANDYTYLDDRGTLDPADDRVVKRENGDATTYDAWALGRVALPGGGRLVLMANAFAREQGLSGASYATAHVARSATQREIGAASIRLPCWLASGAGEDAMDRCSIDLASSLLLARRDIDDPEREVGFSSTRAATSGDRWEEKARVRARVGESLRLGAGVFVGLDRFEVNLAKGLQTRAARLGVTASADVTWTPLRWFTLFALVGGECHSAVGHSQGVALQTEGASAEDRRACANGGPVGRAGVRVPMPLGVELVASAGSYLRVPVLGELYGLSGVVLGNPDLVPERGTTAEASARWTGGTTSGAVRAYADLTGFARFVEELIVYKLTRPSTIKPFNVAAARVVGVEIGAGIDMFHHLRAQTALTVADPRNVTAGVPKEGSLLPYHAEVTGSWTLEAYADPSASLRFVNRLALGARFSYRSARYADSSTNFYLREQRDLGLDVSAVFFRQRLGARVSVSNLLDIPNQDLLGFPQPGRAVHGTLEATW